MPEYREPIGVSEDGEDVIPDGATQGWEVPGDSLVWKSADGTRYFARPLPGLEKFLAVAEAAWNKRATS